MSGWECRRCGQINAGWREKCDCPPPSYVSDATNFIAVRLSADTVAPEKEVRP